MPSICRVTCCRVARRSKRAPPNSKRRRSPLRTRRSNQGSLAMFKTILHANDGSEPAFRALALAIDIARQDAAQLHLVCVEEIPPMPEYLAETREAKGRAGAR